MISIGYLHEHSLDNNDFQSKHEYEEVIAGVKWWMRMHNKRIFFENNLMWNTGDRKTFKVKLQELIQYEE